jgi:hypothetical protein
MAEEWREAIDKKTGRIYYWNTVTRQTTWSNPVASASIITSIDSKQTIHPMTKQIEALTNHSLHLVDFVENWKMLNASDMLIVSAYNNYALARHVSSVLEQTGLIGSDYTACCFLLRELSNLIPEIIYQLFGRTEQHFCRLPLRLSWPSPFLWERVLRVWLPHQDLETIRMYSRNLSHAGYSLAQFCEVRDQLREATLLELEFRPEDIDIILNGNANDPEIIEAAEIDEQNFAIRLHLLLRTLHGLDPEEISLDVAVGDTAVAQLLAALEYDFDNVDIKLDVVRVLLLSGTLEKSGESELPAVADSVVLLLRHSQAADESKTKTEFALSNRIAEEAADFVAMSLRRLRSTFSSLHLEDIFECLVSRFETCFPPSFHSPAYLCCLKLIATYHGNSEVSGGHMSVAARDRLAVIASNLHKDFDRLKIAGSEAIQMHQQVEEILAALAELPVPPLQTTAISADVSEENFGAADDAYYYRSFDQKIHEASGEGNLLTLASDVQAGLVSNHHPMLQSGLRTLLQMFQCVGSARDWQTLLCDSEGALVHCLLSACLTTRAGFAPRLFDTGLELVKCFASICPRLTADVFASSDRFLMALCASVPQASRDSSTLLRLKVLGIILGNMHCNRVASGFPPEIFDGKSPSGFKPPLPKQDVSSHRMAMIRHLWVCLLSRREEVVTEGAKAIVSLALVGLGSASQARCLQYCVEHEQSGILLERLIPFANSTQLAPNQTRAAFKFIEILLAGQRFDLFYTNDLKVLVEILVRMLNDTHSLDPVMKAYLGCLNALLGWPEYLQSRFFAEELVEAVNLHLFC